MVYDPDTKDIFILTRDIETFRANGDREFALKFVKDQGFPTPLETFQSSKLCDYTKFDVLPNNITALMQFKLAPPMLPGDFPPKTSPGVKLPPDISPPKIPPGPVFPPMN